MGLAQHTTHRQVQVIINVDSTLASFATGKSAERRWLHEYLSFPNPKARFFRAQHGDGRVHMMSDITGMFPAGFVAAVQKAGAEEGIKVEVVNKATNLVVHDQHADTSWLMAHQQEAVEIAKTHPRGVFQHPTGSGKGEIVVALAELYPVDWIFLVHSKDLVEQQIKRFEARTGEECGRIMEGQWTTRRVTCATFQSVYKAIMGKGRKREAMREYLANVDGIMVDECHRVPAHTFYKVCMSCKASLRYGFSGTPFSRTDKKDLYAWGAIGPIIHRIESQRLIDAGIIAKPKIRMIKVQQNLGSDSWNDAYSDGVVNSTPRNAKVLAAAQLATKPCLLFVKLLSHGRLLSETLRAMGIKSEFVWGEKNVAMRQAAVRRLVHGDTDVLVCNVIFQEGIDIPELQSVILASGGKSNIMVLQSLGRGSRVRDSAKRVTKTEFEVFDFMDKGCGCKAPRKHRSCKWLESHTRSRLKAYASESFEVTEETRV